MKPDHDEDRSVTPGVAGSSPVRSAITLSHSATYRNVAEVLLLEICWRSIFFSTFAAVSATNCWRKVGGHP